MTAVPPLPWSCLHNFDTRHAPQKLTVAPTNLSTIKSSWTPYIMCARRSLYLFLVACACSTVRSVSLNCSLSPSQKLAAMQLTNLFENGVFKFDYGNILPITCSLMIARGALLSLLCFLQDTAKTYTMGEASQRDSLVLQQQTVCSLLLMLRQCYCW